MEEENLICPFEKNCPIFLKNVFLREQSKVLYKTVYCLRGYEKYSTCKRFIVSQLTNKEVPDTVMPNSSQSIEDIIKMMK